jgi:hypothetical protein
MFDWLIPLLIVIILLIGILEYLDLLDLVTGFVGLMVAGVVGIVKLTVRLVRHFAGPPKPQSGASSPDAALLRSPPPSPERGSREGRGRWGGSRKRP